MRFSLLFYSSLFLYSCSDANTDWKLPIRAEILESTDGDYDLEVVEIFSLHNPSNMQGEYGKILGGASLDANKNINEIVAFGDPESIYIKRGKSVKLNFEVKNEIIYPLDLESMEMLGLYHAYEKTIDFWLKEVEIPIEKNDFPSLFYNPSISSRGDGNDVSVTVNLNAAYLSGAKDFWFFQTSPLELVPVKMNFGVISHEFGHYLFDRFFADFDPTFYETNSFINSYKLSAINEGIADFLSFLVTDSVNEFGASLELLGKERRLPVSWSLSELNKPICTGSFYCEGSVLASALFEAKKESELSRVAMASIILSSLEDFSSDWDLNNDDSNFDYHFIINAILNNLSSNENKAIFCKYFKKRFDITEIREQLLCEA